LDEKDYIFGIISRYVKTKFGVLNSENIKKEFGAVFYRRVQTSAQNVTP